MQAFYSGRLARHLPPWHRFAMQNRADYSAVITVDKVEPQILREIGFPWAAAVEERVRRSVSGMLQATGYQWKNWIWPPVTVHRREDPSSTVNLTGELYETCNGVPPPG